MTDREEQICQMFSSGASDEEIGQALGVAARTAKRDRLALNLKKRERSAQPVSDEAIRLLHAEGLVNAEIGKRLGLTHRTVQQKMSNLGLKSHAGPRAGRPRGKSLDSRSEKVIAYVSPAELEWVEATAASQGMTRAEYARRGLSLPTEKIPYTMKIDRGQD